MSCPNPEKTFVAADPALNHFWYAPAGLTVLAPNLTKTPFNDVKFREALAYGMDKESATRSRRRTGSWRSPASPV